MEVKATLTEGMQFDMKLGSGYQMEIGGSPDIGGNGNGARPMELLLAGLAGCTSVDVVLILRRARQELTGYEIKVTAERAKEDPKVFTHIHMEYVIRGRNIEAEKVKRAIHLSETKYCSAAAMLGAVAKIETSYRIEQE